MVTGAPVPPPVATSPLEPPDDRASSDRFLAAGWVVALPPFGSPERWPWLQRLRRQRAVPLEPWLRALENGQLVPHADLLAVLADHLDGPAMARLLRWWLRVTPRDPNLPGLMVHRRDPQGRAALREACSDPSTDPEALLPLLPLLGHQRHPEDFPLLRAIALEPGPLGLRQAALEGLCRGLGAWPRPALRRALTTLARDLHPALAASAIDALARLPEARPSLRALALQGGLDPAASARLERRLRRLPAAPLVLLIHGRSGGMVPPELAALALELEERRGAPVLLESLTAPQPLTLPAPWVEGATLVPLFLLPGGHVRRDVPDRLRRWRAAGRMRALPFLGAWPAWQALLAAEVERLAAGVDGLSPLLVHHPVDGPLPRRYMRHLLSLCGARGLPFAPGLDGGRALERLSAPALPLALATSRLTDGLGDGLGVPLLARPVVRAGLARLLEDLP
jgi:sirohydrochlorin ferrochelatase